MNKPLCFVAFGFALLSSACCHAGEIKIQILRGAESVETLNFPADKVKASAKSFDFDSETNSWNLSGDVAITIGRNIPLPYISPPTRVVGDRANLVADNIEWQIYSNHYIPIKDLSNFLSAHPEVSIVRLGWGYSVGGYGSSSTGLYDRSSGIIKERSVYGDTATGGAYVNSYLYEGVTDNMIYKATEDANKRKSGLGDFSLNILEDYGATRKERR